MIDLGHKNVIDVVKYRFVWLLISGLLVLPGIGAMIYSSLHYENHAPLKVGIDFTGGTITQYATSEKIDTAKIGEIVDSNLETDIKNLFVCDASVLPISPGKPPILTILALSKRLADYLKKE